MAREMERGRVGSERERRGDHRTSTDWDSRTEGREERRRGGGRYDAGPGREGMPTAEEMDRRASEQGAFVRTGDARRGYDREQRRIQDAERR